MDQRRVAQVFVGSIFAFILIFLCFAAYNFNKQSSMEDQLLESGVAVTGMIQKKHKSSGGENTSPSYVIDVEYQHDGATFTRSFSVRSDRYEELKEKDTISVTLQPEKPKASQLTEVLGTPLSGRGFIAE